VKREARKIIRRVILKPDEVDEANNSFEEES